jgi:type I restriction enzyme R subunit
MISMIKHAADFQLPIMNATERVTRAMEKVTAGKEFSPEQHQWLSYISDHLIENLAIGVEDFDSMPVFEQHGGLGKAKKVFGNQLTKLVEQLNTAVAA